MPCCIKQAARPFWFKGTKAWHVQIHNIIKYNYIKCGTITHATKETRQQKQQWGQRL